MTGVDTASFLFADLAGFTALTEEIGDDAAADLALSFCDRICVLNEGHAAKDVKTIGDEVMVRVPNAAQAICLALDIVEEVGPEHGFPLVRVGLHHGSAVERRGDYFGATVNIAARVAALAQPREVLLTDTVRDAVTGSLESVAFEDLGAQYLRNVRAPVRLLRAQRPVDGRPGHRVTAV